MEWTSLVNFNEAKQFTFDAKGVTEQRPRSREQHPGSSPRR